MLTRSFIAPGQLVFDAYTKPELLTRWFGARGWNLVGLDVELREGSRYRFESLGPDGVTMFQAGIIGRIQAPLQLVLTEPRRPVVSWRDADDTRVFRAQ